MISIMEDVTSEFALILNSDTVGRQHKQLERRTESLFRSTVALYRGRIDCGSMARFKGLWEDPYYSSNELHCLLISTCIPLQGTTPPISQIWRRLKIKSPRELQYTVSSTYINQMSFLPWSKFNQRREKSGKCGLVKFSPEGKGWGTRNKKI